MKKFVSIRVRKLRAWGNGSVKNGKEINGVEGLSAHDLRLIRTDNADPNRLRQNTICCAETNWRPAKLTTALAKEIGADRVDFFANKAKQRIEKLGIKDNTPDSCKVANLMLMVSPQWLRDGSETNPVNSEKASKWNQLASEFLRQKFGENYLGDAEHLDELNPHKSAYVLPAVKKLRKKRGPNSKSKKRESVESWGLDSKSMFTPDIRIVDPSDPKEKQTLRIPESGTCSRIQTEFAEFLQKNGLDVERGIVGSRAKHREISEQNHLLRSQAAKREDVEKIADVETLRQMVLSGQMKAQDYDRLVREINRLKEQMSEDQKPLLFANQLLAVEKEALEEERKRLSTELSEKSRAVPVGELIQKLTEADPRPGENGKEIYVLHTGMKLEVDPGTNKFRNLTPEIEGAGNMATKAGGKGGIDLAIFLTGCNPDAAKTLIADLFSIDAAAASIAKTIEEEPQTPEREALANHAKAIAREINKADETKWLELRAILIDQLNFNATTVDTLKKSRWISANRLGHLVTTRATIVKVESEKKLKTSGYIVQDVRESDEAFYGENGDNGHAIIARFKSSKHTIVAADPLEALALQAYHHRRKIERDIIVIGRKPKPKTTVYLRALAKKTSLMVACARTEIGKAFAEWVKSVIPQVTEITPPKSWKSWSEYIRTPEEESDPAKPQLHIVENNEREDFGT